MQRTLSAEAVKATLARNTPESFGLTPIRAVNDTASITRNGGRSADV